MNPLHPRHTQSVVKIGSIAEGDEGKEGEGKEGEGKEGEAELPPAVFLGGACNPTIWRSEIAMPMLTSAGVTYFNPQTDDWDPEFVQVEAMMKERAEMLLFVLTKETRGIASMIETAEYIKDKRRVYVVIEEMSDADFHENVKTFEAKQKLCQSAAYLGLRFQEGEDQEGASDTDATSKAPIPKSLPELPQSYLLRQTALDDLRAQLVGGDEANDADAAVPNRVCAFGAGGTGKTTMAVAILMESVVRLHFEKVVWVSVGQSPNIFELQVRSIIDDRQYS